MKSLKELAITLETRKNELNNLIETRVPGEHGARRSIRRAELAVEEAKTAYNEAYKAMKTEKSETWEQKKAIDMLARKGVTLVNDKTSAVETNLDSRPAKRRAARKAAPSPMSRITRFVVEEGKYEPITIFGSAATRQLKKMGVDVTTNVMKITSVVKSREDAEMDRIAMLMTHYATSGFVKDDVNFAPLLAAASDTRKGQATWMNRQYAGAYWKWSMCGLDLTKITGKIAVNKYMAYQGLLWSASKTFKEVFGIDIDPSRVAICSDRYVKVTGIMDVVHEDGTVEHGVLRTVEINAFDGMGAIRTTLTDGESVTIRAPWVKAFVQACNWDEVIAWFKANTGSAKIETIYGERNLEELDVVLTVSCFKAAKLYDSWEQYEKAFRELGHEFAVCVREHKPHLKGLPYQQGQTLQGNDEDVEHFAQHSLATVAKYEAAKEAVNLLSGYQKMVAIKYPALLKEVGTARTIQERIASRKRQMMGGKIPELGYNAFIAADMMAFWQGVAGMEITGSLKAGECSLLLHKEGLTDVTRSPHLDNAHVLLYNVRKMAFVPEKTPTCFVNVFDLTTIRLRCDYDGDHVWYSQDEHLIDLVQRTAEVLMNLPIDWETPESSKGAITKATIAEYIANLLKGSEIGLYADALTKMWANGYDHDVCCWLTYAGNVLIDAAKHGNIKIEKPDAVKAVDKMSLPLFAAYAKADDSRPIGKYWFDRRLSVATENGKDLVYESDYKGNGEDILDVYPPRAQYSGSFLDRYSRRVSEIVPDHLEIKGLDDKTFDPFVLMINPDRKAGKLGGIALKPRVYDPATGNWEADGLFEKIAFRQSDEWKSLIPDDNFKMNFQEWEEFKKNESIAEMVDWARAQYAGNAAVEALSDEKILEAIYDIVTRRVFSRKMTEGMDTVIKAAYWRIFGEMAYKTVCRNLQEEALAFDAEEDLQNFLEEMGVC